MLFFGLEPYVVKGVYLAGTEQPNHWVDISEVFDTKVEAIRCHVSQVREPENLVERLKERATAVDQYGREVLREEFRVMRIG
jgi:LmbE family N-acetylglucosaminyl deacetylase